MLDPEARCEIPRRCSIPGCSEGMGMMSAPRRSPGGSGLTLTARQAPIASSARSTTGCRDSWSSDSVRGPWLRRLGSSRLHLTSMVRTTLVGSYPRVSDRSLPVNLRQMLHQHDRGEIKDIELERAYQATIARVVKEQEEAGIDLLTDGQIRWDDLLTPLTRQLEGAHAGGLLRYFDNNVYYRHPVIEGPLRWRSQATVQDYRTAAAGTTIPVKAVLPGPITYASLS